jgi:hypothetical protein
VVEELLAIGRLPNLLVWAREMMNVKGRFVTTPKYLPSMIIRVCLCVYIKWTFDVHCGYMNNLDAGTS